MANILRTIKIAAVCLGIAVVATAVVVFGALIGVVLTFLVGVALVALILCGLWSSIQENQKKRKG